MRKVGVAELPLHHGTCPPWLFERMKKLALPISEIIIYEYGEDEFLRRLADPFFFQSFACVLGFDWHSSGVTTTVCGALKEALNQENLGIAVCGGKGKTSRKAPTEIEKFGEALSIPDSKIKNLVYSSKMSAKVDNTALQDGYSLYHHVFIFTEKGKWAVIQQGMNYENRYARRYHWLSDSVQSFVEEPHEAICCDKKEKDVLDMTAMESNEARKISLDLIKDNPKNIEKSFNEIKHNVKNKKLTLIMPRRINWSAIKNAYDIQPKNYEEFLSLQGIGPASVRALALISDLIYGKPPSWRDPVKYSFAHGGKDGVPYFVNRKKMDESIEILKSAIDSAKLGNKEKIQALKRLRNFL